MKQSLGAVFIFLLLTLVTACDSSKFMKPYYASVQGMDLGDDDEDGVINARDICAETPLTSQIDEHGCSEWNIEHKYQDFTFEFGFDKDKVLPEHEAQIEQILDLILKNDSARILLVGDTSPEGNDKYNAALGKRRADALTYNLITKGVDENRIVGFVWSDDGINALLKKRERRTIVRVVYRTEESIKKWNIYTAEESREVIL